MEVGYDFLDAEDEFCGFGLDFVLVLDGIEGEGGLEFVPIGPGQFHEIVEDEVVGFPHVPAVGQQLLLQNFNFIGQEHQAGALFRLHLNYYKPLRTCR